MAVYSNAIVDSGVLALHSGGAGRALDDSNSNFLCLCGWRCLYRVQEYAWLPGKHATFLVRLKVHAAHALSEERR